MTIHRAGRSRLEGATEYLQADVRDPDAISGRHREHPELGEPVPGRDDGVIPGCGAVARKR